MIQFKSDGSIFKKFDDDKTVKQITTDLVPYLNEAIEFEGGLTFETFMQHIFNHEDIYSMVFASHLGHYPLHSWKEEFYKDYEKDNDAVDIEYLEVMHAYIEINMSGPNQFGITEVDIYHEFHGVGSWGKDENGKETIGGIAVEFTPLNELKNYELKLNNQVKFLDLNTFDEICTMEHYFTVYDVISTILYEISWSGSPRERDKKSKEILSEIKKAEKSETRYLSHDEVFSNLEKRIEEFKKDKKDIGPPLEKT